MAIFQLFFVCCSYKIHKVHVDYASHLLNYFTLLIEYLNNNNNHIRGRVIIVQSWVYAQGENWTNKGFSLGGFPKITFKASN